MLKYAEIIDGYRIVPRLILGLYCYVGYNISQWFMYIDEPTSQQSAFVSTYALTTSAVIGLYQKTGRTWEK